MREKRAGILRSCADDIGVALRALKYLKLILDGELKNPKHKYCQLDYIFKTDFSQYLDGNPAEGLVSARHYYNNGLADVPRTLEEYRKVMKDLAGLSINI